MSRFKAPIEEIDLTLSSPEPEPKPRPQSRPHPQPERQPNVPKHYLEAVERNRDAGIKRESTRTSAAPTPDLPIHPAHLERIVKTCDPKAVQQLVLDLCKMSPALSGAVARGLFKHSSYAQSLQKKYGTKTNSRRLDMPGPSRIRNASPTVHVKAQVKEERFADSDTSTSTAFSETIQNPPRGKPSTKPHRPATPGYMLTRKDTTGASASSYRSFTAQEPISSFAKRLDVQQPTSECERCHHQFRVGSQNGCFYHPGRKMKSEDNTGRRITRYTCCEGDDIDPPCEQGNHVARTVSALDSLKRRRPDEPSPFPNYKSPRLS